MAIVYDFEISGTAADGQTWATTGFVVTEGPGDFMTAPSLAMKESFSLLTNGKAVFGLPGIGCHGPYAITSMLIKRTGADHGHQ